MLTITPSIMMLGMMFGTMPPRSTGILLANCQKGGLEGEALQETFLCCFFCQRSWQKKQQKGEAFEGLRPRSPRWRVSQQYQQR